MNALTTPTTPVNYAIEDGFIITEAGSDYVQGDALIVPSPLIDAVFIVNTVSVSKRGLFPAQVSGQRACYGGHGSGCAITVTSALAPNTTLADISDPQPNDEVIVLKDETHSNERYRAISTNTDNQYCITLYPVSGLPA
jgi:hypothetical protein